MKTEQEKKSTKRDERERKRKIKTESIKPSDPAFKFLCPARSL